VSVTPAYCIETAAWIELIFCIQVSLNLCYAALLGNYDVSKNNGTSLWNLEHFAMAHRRSVSTIYTVTACGLVFMAPLAAKGRRLTCLALVQFLVDLLHGEGLAALSQR